MLCSASTHSEDFCPAWIWILQTLREGKPSWNASFQMDIIRVILVTSSLAALILIFKGGVSERSKWNAEETTDSVAGTG